MASMTGPGTRYHAGRPAAGIIPSVGATHKLQIGSRFAARNLRLTVLIGHPSWKPQVLPVSCTSSFCTLNLCITANYRTGNPARPGSNRQTSCITSLRRVASKLGISECVHSTEFVARRVTEDIEAKVGLRIWAHSPLFTISKERVVSVRY